MEKEITLKDVIKDIEDLKNQNKFYFDNIKEVDRLINNLETEIKNARNFNNTINYKIQYDYEKLKRIILDENISITLKEEIKNNLKYTNEKLSKKLDNAEFEKYKNNNENDKKSISEQFETIITKNTEFKEQMKTDFGNAKTDYFGEEHLNVVDRLNSDFDNVHQRINDSNYLQYEGTNITADNTYYGLTKEMSIKGRTLQNLIVEDYKNQTLISSDAIARMKNYSSKLIKPNTKYTFIFNVIENNLLQALRFGSVEGGCFINSNLVEPKYIGLIKVVVTSALEFSDTTFTITTNMGGTEENKITYDVLLLEGDYTNTPIEELPFGEGIYSVGESEITEEGKYKISWKSCGKNLFDGKLQRGYWYGGVLKPSDYAVANINNVPIKINTTYSFYIEGYNGNIYIDELDNTLNVVKNFAIKNGGYITTTNGKFIRFCTFNGESGKLEVDVKVQIEEGTVATEYEPYQESIQELELTEPLRSLPNGVADEILEDGTEIRRVNKLIIDYNHIWYKDGAINEENTMRFGYKIEQIYTSKDGSKNKISDWTTNMLHDGVQYYTDSESISFNVSKVSIRVLKSKLSEESVTGFKQWLQNNPITVYYELAEPIIKKHNKNINLKTFEGTTHITSDNYLQPTLSCKVPSNVQAVVSSLMLENEELNNTISVMSLESEEQNLSNIETNLDQDVRLTMLELGVI